MAGKPFLLDVCPVQCVELTLCLCVCRDAMDFILLNQDDELASVLGILWQVASSNRPTIFFLRCRPAAIRADEVRS